MELTQSHCSRHRIFMRVSARLQATAAPEAPAPMIRTSTIASVGRAALELASAMSASFAVHVAPHPRSATYRIQERPIALFQDMALREWWSRFAAQSPHHAV